MITVAKLDAYLDEDKGEEDVCPSCGDLTLLDLDTGWCPTCMNEGTIPNPSCIRCGKNVSYGHYQYCSSCRYMLWLEQNANKIEVVMVTVEVSAATAKKIVRLDNRPSCLCCGELIKGGQQGKNFFCSRTKACKTGQNSYHYYQTRRDRNALSKALTAATMERLITNAASRRE